jgi:hypothetical protein
VLLDDVQWADTGTLRLLVHLARNLGDGRVVVVAAYRSTETAGSPALRDALAALARERGCRRGSATARAGSRPATTPTSSPSTATP